MDRKATKAPRYITKGKGLAYGVYDTLNLRPPMLFATSEAREAKACCVQLNAAPCEESDR